MSINEDAMIEQANLDAAIHAEFLNRKAEHEYELKRAEDAHRERVAEALQVPEVARVVKAAQAWVDYFDGLERHADPSDTLAKARRLCHGKRVEETRAALAPFEEVRK